MWTLLSPFSIKKALFPEYEFISDNYTPFIEPIPWQIGFVTLYEFF